VPRDGEDATVNDVKPPRSDPAVDRANPQGQGEQLRAGYDAVLAAGERTDHPVHRSRGELTITIG
jgi:hypothetical protein